MGDSEVVDKQAGKPPATKKILLLLKERFTTLNVELENAVRTDRALDEQIQLLTAKLEADREDSTRRREELEVKYRQEYEDYTKQIKLGEDMLEKKKAERESLISYLEQSRVFVTSNLDIDARDWDFWRNQAQLASGLEDGANKVKKLEKLDSLNKKAVKLLNHINVELNEIVEAKNKFAKEYENFKEQTSELKVILCDQENKLNKLTAENDTLACALKQYMRNPRSKFTAECVRRHCQSFVDSRSQDKLAEGLRKYLIRQRGVMECLKVEENKLSRELNQLMISRDQAIDDGLYYTN